MLEMIVSYVDAFVNSDCEAVGSIYGNNLPKWKRMCFAIYKHSFIWKTCNNISNLYFLVIGIQFQKFSALSNKT